MLSIEAQNYAGLELSIQQSLHADPTGFTVRSECWEFVDSHYADREFKEGNPYVVGFLPQLETTRKNMKTVTNDMYKKLILLESIKSNLSVKLPLIDVGAGAWKEKTYYACDCVVIVYGFVNACALASSFKQKSIYNLKQGVSQLGPFTDHLPPSPVVNEFVKKVRSLEMFVSAQEKTLNKKLRQARYYFD